MEKTTLETKRVPDGTGIQPPRLDAELYARGEQKRTYWQAKAYCEALTSKIEGTWPFKKKTMDPLAFHVCMEEQGYYISHKV